MTVKRILSERVAEIYEGNKNAHVTVWKGYDAGTGQNGWHYVPFGETPIFLGTSKDDALEMLQDVADYREEVMSNNA